MTTRPTIGANRVDTDIVTATDWNRDVVQQANWAQEVIAGTNTDKIPASAITGAVGYYPNILVNGGMEFDQRNSGAVYTPVAGTPLLTQDRWVASLVAPSATAAVQRANAIDTGSQYSLSTNYTHAGGRLDIYQNVENFAEFRGKTVSVSSRCYGNGTGCYMMLFDGTTTATSGRTVNAVMTTLTATLAVGATATALQVIFRHDATVFVYIDNVMLALSATPIDYIQRPYAEELLLCKRYYQKIRNTTRWRTGAAAGEVRDSPIVFPVSMAGGTPTGVVTAGTRNNITSATLLDITTDSARQEFTATAAAATDTYSIGDSIAFEYNP